jgi:hypothetical protein
LVLSVCFCKSSASCLLTGGSRQVHGFSQDSTFKFPGILRFSTPPTSIIACISKGFTGVKCKIARFHAGAHGFTGKTTCTPTPLPKVVLILIVVVVSVSPRLAPVRLGLSASSHSLSPSAGQIAPNRTNRPTDSLFRVGQYALITHQICSRAPQSANRPRHTRYFALFRDTIFFARLKPTQSSSSQIKHPAPHRYPFKWPALHSALAKEGR